MVVPEHSELIKEAKEKEKFVFPVISVEKLADMPMVSMPLTTNSGNLARELFKSRQIEPNVILEVSDIRSLLDAVENDIGIAICMDVPLGTRKLRYLLLEEADPIEQVTNLVYRSDKALNEAMKYFIQLITRRKEDL